MRFIMADSGFEKRFQVYSLACELYGEPEGVILLRDVENPQIEKSETVAGLAAIKVKGMNNVGMDGSAWPYDRVPIVVSPNDICILNGCRNAERWAMALLSDCGRKCRVVYMASGQSREMANPSIS